MITNKDGQNPDLADTFEPSSETLNNNQKVFLIGNKLDPEFSYLCTEMDSKNYERREQCRQEYCICITTKNVKHISSHGEKKLDYGWRFPRTRETL